MIIYSITFKIAKAEIPGRLPNTERKPKYFNLIESA